MDPIRNSSPPFNPYVLPRIKFNKNFSDLGKSPRPHIQSYQKTLFRSRSAGLPSSDPPKNPAKSVTAAPLLLITYPVLPSHYSLIVRHTTDVYADAHTAALKIRTYSAYKPRLYSNQTSQISLAHTPPIPFPLLLVFPSFYFLSFFDIRVLQGFKYLV